MRETASDITEGIEQSVFEMCSRIGNLVLTRCVYILIALRLFPVRLLGFTPIHIRLEFLNKIHCSF